MQYSELLERAKRELADITGAKAFEALEEYARSFPGTGAGYGAVREGNTVPEIILPSASSGRVILSEILAGGPAVLVFFRGGWCPFARVQLKKLEDIHGRVQDMGAWLGAVSPQNLDFTRQTKEELGLTFELLSDKGNAFAGKLGLSHLVPEDVRRALSSMGASLGEVNADGSWALPIPSAFVVESTGRIASAWVQPDFMAPPDPSLMLEALEEVKSGESVQ
jgi:peroxiredoxin